VSIGRSSSAFGKAQTGYRRGLLQFSEGSHVIFHLIGADAIDIIGVLHKQMDVLDYFTQVTSWNRTPPIRGRQSVSVRLVREALTKPEHLKEWFMPKAWERVSRAGIDLRPGGIISVDIAGERRTDQRDHGDGRIRDRNCLRSLRRAHDGDEMISANSQENKVPGFEPAG